MNRTTKIRVSYVLYHIVTKNLRFAYIVCVCVYVYQRTYRSNIIEIVVENRDR